MQGGNPQCQPQHNLQLVQHEKPVAESAGVRLAAAGMFAKDYQKSSKLLTCMPASVLGHCIPSPLVLAMVLSLTEPPSGHLRLVGPTTKGDTWRVGWAALVPGPVVLHDTCRPMHQRGWVEGSHINTSHHIITEGRQQCHSLSDAGGSVTTGCHSGGTYCNTSLQCLKVTPHISSLCNTEPLTPLTCPHPHSLTHSPGSTPPSWVSLSLTRAGTVSHCRSRHQKQGTSLGSPGSGPPPGLNW
jgi:hypothetical protein